MTLIVLKRHKTHNQPTILRVPYENYFLNDYLMQRAVFRTIKSIFSKCDWVVALNPWHLGCVQQAHPLWLHWTQLSILVGVIFWYSWPQTSQRTSFASSSPLLVFRFLCDFLVALVAVEGNGSAAEEVDGPDEVDGPGSFDFFGEGNGTTTSSTSSTTWVLVPLSTWSANN